MKKKNTRKNSSKKYNKYKKKRNNNEIQKLDDEKEKTNFASPNPKLSLTSVNLISYKKTYKYRAYIYKKIFILAY